MHSSSTVAEPRRASGPIAEIKFLGRALRNPLYRRFALSSLVSVTGTWMQVVAQNWLVFELTGSAGPVGVTIMLQSLPSVGLGVWGGALADRFSKRTILLVTQPLLAVLAIALGLLCLVGAASIPIVYAFALALGLVNAVDAPAHGAFGAELVDEDELGNAVALGSIFNSAGRIIGMALGGFIVAAFGAAPVFLVNGCSYFAVVVALVTLRVDAPSQPDTEHHRDGGVRDVMRFVATTPALLGALALVVLVSALGRNYQVTMASMSSDVFGSGAAGYATLSSVFAVGALLGGGVAARCRRHDLTTMLAVALVTGLGQVFASMMPTFVTFATCIAGLAVGAVVFDTAASTLIQQTAGSARRGRLVAVLTVVSMAGATVGAPILGWLSDHLDPRTALQIGGAAVFVGAFVVSACKRRRRQASTTPPEGLPSPPRRAAPTPRGDAHVANGRMLRPRLTHGRAIEHARGAGERGRGTTPGTDRHPEGVAPSHTAGPARGLTRRELLVPRRRRRVRESS